LLVVAAGYYFLVYRASTPPRRTAAQSGETERVAAVAEPHASTVATEGQVDPPREAAASTPAKPVEPAAQDAALSNEIKNAQGRFSLQAAAFPTQSGADEFADKLKRAGLPSYVASVELARRGRWFRVRIGRFNAADDAQKFAGEAQQRARAAGLSLQLIVCQYDQP
jgi:cell division protein FtsN